LARKDTAVAVADIQLDQWSQIFCVNNFLKKILLRSFYRMSSINIPSTVSTARNRGFFCDNQSASLREKWL